MLHRATMRLFVAALVQFAAAPASADENASLQRAEAAYRRLDFEKVLPLLNEARVHDTTPAEYKRIVELTAFVHAIYGHTLAARDAFIELIGIDPDYHLPAGASPKMRDALASAIAASSTTPVESPASSARVPTPTPAPTSTPTPLVTTLPDATTIPPPVITDTVPTPLYTRWWFWTAAGVVAAGVATTAILLHNRPPASDFGPYRVR